MSLELGPVLEVLVKHGERLFVVSWKLDFFPELLGEMGAFNCLHVQIALAFLFKDGGIAGISQWARVP